MIKKNGIQMSDQNFISKDIVSIIAFVEDFKKAFHAYIIHRKASMLLFELFVGGFKRTPHQQACRNTDCDPMAMETGLIS